MQPRRNNIRWLTSTVFGIGMASLFSDLSHETVTSVMPTLLASMGVAAGAMHDEVLAAVRECVTHDFKIAQATVQVESKGCAENETHL